MRNNRATLTRAALEVETAGYRGTGGISENNRSLGFQPAFIDRRTGAVHLSRFADGRLAPCHLLDGLPDQLVLARDEQGHATCARDSVESGFLHEGHFHTRCEAAAMLVAAPDGGEG
jgi:hypothetical protein